jgi:hypothetical protein
MSPAKELFKVWKVNLVEQPGWAPFDPAGDLSEDIFNLAGEFLGGMDKEDVIPLLEDVAETRYNPRAPEGPHEWSPRRLLTRDDLLVISREVLKGERDLELVDSIIRDTATWMYEAGLTPTDIDITDALHEAKSEVKEVFELGVLPDPWDLGVDNIWSPLLETGLTLEGILSEIVVMGVKYHRQAGHYDRFLEFDLNMAGAPAMLLKEIPKKDRGWVKKALMEDWKRLSEDLTRRFFQILSNDMKNIDYRNRISWKKTWKDVLKSTNLEPIQKEMLTFIRERPTEDE